MKRRVAHWLARLYPAAWRERYGEEFDALVEDSRPGWRGLADIAWGALAMRWRAGLGPVLTTLLFGVAGLAVAIPVAFLIPDRFQSQAVIKAPAYSGNPQPVALAVQRVLRRDMLLGLIHRHRLYLNMRRSAPMEEVVDQFQKDIAVTDLRPIRGGRQAAFRLGFSSGDAAQAQRVTRELMTMVIDEYARQNRAAPGLEVLDMPPLPQPFFPNRPVVAFTGLLAGALSCALVLLVRRVVRRLRIQTD